MWLILIPFPVVASLMFAFFHPYMKNNFNTIDGLAFALLALTIYLMLYAVKVKPFPIVLLYLMGLIPFLYFISFILFKIFSRVALFRTCYTMIGEILKARKENHQLHTYRDDEDLPDRIVNPGMYQPLLQATDSGEENFQSESQSKAGVNSLVAYGSV